jgi:hypothetical protein
VFKGPQHFLKEPAKNHRLARTPENNQRVLRIFYENNVYRIGEKPSVLFNWTAIYEVRSLDL